VRRYSEDATKDHRCLEQRHIAVLEVDDSNRSAFQGVRQAFRIDRDREIFNDPDSVNTEAVYEMTSAPASRADANQLLSWNRIHRVIESSHYIRDRTFGEDACLTCHKHLESSFPLQTLLQTRARICLRLCSPGIRSSAMLLIQTA